MGGDPLDDIMGYLGLGRIPAEPAARSVTSADAPASAAGDRMLAQNGRSSLWLAGNDNAEWIEMRGPFATLRATRPKANLLFTVRIDIERWADGGSPQLKVRDLTIATVTRLGDRVLEITHRTWKPIRLSRVQAQALLKLIDHVRIFAKQA